jgi:hypothetical protein
MKITEAELEAELNRFGPDRIRSVAELVHQGQPDGIGTALMLAIGSRETNLANIVGDHGHGRGWLQIDDRFHGPWLKAHAGCKDGTWKAAFSSALPSGRVPTLTASTMHTIDMLQSNVAFGAARGVPLAQRIRFAVAAYNAGPTGAIHGFAGGNVDANTAHGDYSVDVLSRRDAVARYLQRHGLPV